MVAPTAGSSRACSAGGGPVNSDTFMNTEEQMQAVEDVVTTHFNLSGDKLRAVCREHAIVIPRQVTFYLIRRTVRTQFEVIGKKYDRSYSTVMWGCKAVENQMAVDPQFKQLIERLTLQCRYKLRPQNETEIQT